MSTNSLIIQKTEDGFRAIYCHWDGYPEYNGKMLLKHYQDSEKITQLLDLGDLSTLGKEIGEKHDFSNTSRDYCTAYGRDRGELNVDAHKTRTLYEMSKLFENSGVEWVYLWNGQEWLYSRTVRYSEMLFTNKSGMLFTNKLANYQFKEDYGI